MSLSKIRYNLKACRTKAEILTEQHLINSMIAYAKQSVIDAVYYYSKDNDTSNLTGNTIAGFSAGVYVNGVLACPVFNALEVAGIQEPTSGYTKPGDSGLSDYDTGEYIGSEDDPFVREYSSDEFGFVSTRKGGNAIDDTKAFLENQHPSKKYITVIVANCSPYVNYLHEFRNFEILDSISKGSKVRKEVVYQLLNNKLKENYRGLTGSDQSSNTFYSNKGAI